MSYKLNYRVLLIEIEFVNRNIKDTNDWKLLLNDQNNNFGSVLTLASIICLLIL